MNGLLKLIGGGDDSGRSSSSSMAASKSSAQIGDPVSLHLYDHPPTRYARRESLPAAMLSREEISIWSVLKASIGKDLSRITMPVVFNEPLSMLQRFSEYMEYASLLDQASREAEPLRRMELVAAFAVSHLAANAERVAKPFNPLLGETFELDRLQSLGFRFFAEQVSHHPPISAFHAESPAARWTFSGSVHPKLRFWGPSVEIAPKGLLSLTLHRFGETYTWNNVTCSVHNLVMGKMYIEHSGVVDIACHPSGLRARLEFKPSASWFSGGGSTAANSVQGSISDGKKRELRAIYGTWTEFIATCSLGTLEAHLPAWAKRQKERRSRLDTQYSVAIAEANGAMPMEEATVPILQGSTVLWRAKPRPACAPKFYYFTLFAMSLNEMPKSDSDSVNLAPTDSRFRPDIRAMERGAWDLAAAEKSRLEEKQRDARKARAKSPHPDWTPKWFEERKHPVLTKETVWLPKRGMSTDINNISYWDRQWKDCDDIF